jgi:uncharacterized iron-regulated membrane protein
MNKLRNSIFKLHKWVGLHIAFFFVFMFLSGALLTLSDEVEKLLHPDIRVAATIDETRASFGQIHDAIVAHDPAATAFVIVRTPIKGAGDRTHANSGDGRKVLYWTDPVTAQVLDVTSQRNFKDIMHELHDSLLVPSRYVFLAVSATSFVLLYSVISGLIAYRRFWRGLLRTPPKGADIRAKWGGWHRLLGLWLAPFLLIIGITGGYFFLGGLNLNGKVPQPPTTEARASARPDGFDGALIDTALQALLAAYPDLDAKTAILPGNPRQGLQFAGPLSTNPGLALYTGSVHPETLQVLGMVSTQDNGGLSAVKQLMNVLHFGTWGGTITRYLWVAMAIGASLLVMGGITIYAARITRNENGSPTVAWRGLGLFKWGYVALVLGVMAMLVVRVIL